MNTAPREQRRGQGWGMFSGDLAIVKERAERTMANLDRQPEYVRRLSHEYGWLAVSTLLQAGISKPTLMEHVITTIRNGGERGWTPVCDQMRAEGKINGRGFPTGMRSIPTPGDAA